MSGLPYQGGMNSDMFDVSQYGVSPSPVMSGLSTLSGAIPVIGPLLAGGMNMLSQHLQNKKQEQFYEEYLSPAARMAQMRAAGINPNAAAQGISGSSAPQMNAAAPTSAFSSLGEALGQSVNTVLTAGNIAAQTKNLEVQTEGQDLMNKMTEVELGMKPSLLSAELDDLKADAKQKNQAVEQSKAEVKKIEQEVENLKTQKEYLIAQIGLVEYDRRLKEAETRAFNAKVALDNAERELTEVNKDIQEKERDNYLTPEQRIIKTAEANAKAPVDNTPEGQLTQMYLDEMKVELAKADEQIKIAKDKGNFARVVSWENEKIRIMRKYRNRIRRVRKGSSAGVSAFGTGFNAGG